jgi:hypothetical protein
VSIRLDFDHDIRDQVLHGLRRLGLMPSPHERRERAAGRMHWYWHAPPN